MKRIYEVGRATRHTTDQLSPLPHPPFTTPLPSPHHHTPPFTTPPHVPVTHSHFHTSPHIFPLHTFPLSHISTHTSPHCTRGGVQSHKDVMDKLFGQKQDVGKEEVEEEMLDTGSQEEVTELMDAGVTLVHLIKEHFSDLMSDQRVNMFTYKNCCSGRRLVEWVMSQSGTTRSRSLVIGMWQALLTEGVLQHGMHLGSAPSVWCVYVCVCV